MQIKHIMSFLICLLLLAAQTKSHDEVYLVRQFYEITPGKPVRSLQIGHNTYDVLYANWQTGDQYEVTAPEKDGYIFLSALSDELTGTFGTEDAYLTLYYTRKGGLPDQNEKSLT